MTENIYLNNRFLQKNCNRYKHFRYRIKKHYVNSLHDILEQDIKHKFQNEVIEDSQVSLNNEYNYMIHFKDRNGLFFEIPKNGSSSFKKIVFSLYDHGYYNGIEKYNMGWKNWHSKFPQLIAEPQNILYKDLFKFCFIRNPFDRLVSAYFNIGWKFVNNDISFCEFIEQIPDRINNFKNDSITMHILPIEFYLPKKEGRFFVDFIGKVEDYTKDVRYILNRLNFYNRFTIPNINKSSHDGYRSYYNGELKKIIELYYGEEIEIGKYRF